MVCILILNDLLTELKEKNYSLSESFQEAITNVFLALEHIWVKWQGHGFHQFSNLAFSVTSVANKDVKYWSYIGEGCSNFKFQFDGLLSLYSVKITCQCQKVEWSWVQRGWESKPCTHLNLCSTTPAKKHGHCSPSTLNVWVEFTLEREEGKATQISSLGSACFKHGFSLKTHLFGLSLISSTQEQNAMPLHWKAFNHIYTLFEKIHRSSNCNEEKNQIIAKFA